MYTGWRIKAREAAGISASQARTRLGVSPGYFYDFEKMGDDMPYELELKMAEMYGVSHEYIRYGVPKTLADDLANAIDEPESTKETIRRRYAAGILYDRGNR